MTGSRQTPHWQQGAHAVPLQLWAGTTPGEGTKRKAILNRNPGALFPESGSGTRPRAAENTDPATVQPSHRNRGAPPQPPALPHGQAAPLAEPAGCWHPRAAPGAGRASTKQHAHPTPQAWGLVSINRVRRTPSGEVGLGRAPTQGPPCPVQAALRPPPGPVPSRQRRQQPDMSAQVHPLQVPHPRCPICRMALQPGTAHPAPWASGLQAKGPGQGA